MAIAWQPLKSFASSCRSLPPSRELCSVAPISGGVLIQPKGGLFATKSRHRRLGHEEAEVEDQEEESAYRSLYFSLLNGKPYPALRQDHLRSLSSFTQKNSSHLYHRFSPYSHRSFLPPTSRFYLIDLNNVSGPLIEQSSSPSNLLPSYLYSFLSR